MQNGIVLSEWSEVLGYKHDNGNVSLDAIAKIEKTQHPDPGGGATCVFRTVTRSISLVPFCFSKPVAIDFSSFTAYERVNFQISLSRPEVDATGCADDSFVCPWNLKWKGNLAASNFRGTPR